MKRFLVRFFIIIIIVYAAFALFYSIEKIEKGKIGVIEDLRINKIIRTLPADGGEYAYAWQGAFPWWFSVYQVTSERIFQDDLKISIPNLENLKEDYYRVTLPLRVNYRIDRRKFSSAGMLADNGHDLDAMVRAGIESELKKELHPYLYPAYQREALALQLNAIPGRLTRELGPEFAAQGLVLKSVALTGSVSLPDRVIYNEGLAHASDLRKIEKAIQKGLIEVRGSMELEKIKNEQYYAKLLKISKIISADPEILKYIYIDKMAGNVKVILSSDNAGFPAMLDDVKKQKKGKSKEIDNLK